MPREHILKTWPNYWEATRDGRKKFEWRKDDRGYEVGDVLVLRQWDPAPCRTGVGVNGFVSLSRVDALQFMDLRVVVTYILRGMHGVPPDYCVMGIELEELKA